MIQLKAFTRWWNCELPIAYRLEDLVSDLTPGVAPMVLLHRFTGVEVKFTRAPKVGTCSSPLLSCTRFPSPPPPFSGSRFHTCHSHPHFQTSSLSSACLRLLPSSSSSSAQQNRLKMMENLSIFIKEAKKLELKIQVSAPTPRTQCIA